MSLITKDDSASLMMSPGDGIESSYNNDVNCHKFIDSINFTTRYQYTLTNLNLNAQQVVVNIPNDGMFNYLILALTFAGTAHSGSNALGIVPIPAYTILQQLQYQLFGSTIYQIDGIQLFFSVAAQCKTQEQLQELILLAGGNGVSSGNGFENSTTYYAFLPMPWNRLYNNKSMGEVKSLIDMTMSQQPMTLRLSFRGSTSIYFNINSGVTIPTAFVNAYVQTRNGYFSSKEQHLNLKQMVVVDGKVETKLSVYTIPVMYEYSTVSPIFAGTVTPTSPAAVTLTGFMKGNLVAIRLALFNVTGNIIGNPSDSTTNYLKTETPQFMQLLFNGTPIYRSDYDAFRMLELINNPKPNKASSDNTNYYYWVEIPIGRFYEQMISDCGQSGVDLSSQTLTLQTNCSTTNNYQWYVTYVYSSTMGFNGDVMTYFF